MITQKLKKLVVEEALKIRKYCYQWEIDNLNLETLNGSNPYNCIYGQLTGNCRSSRAIKLLNLCTKPFSKSHYHESSKGYNNRTLPKTFGKIHPSDGYSPIEYYICQEGAKIEDLVNLIKS